MKVIATKPGFDGAVMRNEGEEFEMPDGAKGSWFKPVKPEGKAKQQPEAKQPDAKTDLA